MECNFSPFRLALLAALIAAFWLLGGFDPLLSEGAFSPRASRAWRYCLLMFLAGAVSASLIDHHVGTLERSNIRLVYILIGAALMISAVLWLRGLKAGLASPSETTQMECPCHFAAG